MEPFFLRAKTWEPVNEDSIKAVMKLAEDDVIKCEVWKQRNYMFLRKYFALLKTTIYHMPENIPDRFRDKDYLRKYIQICIGSAEVMVGLTGRENFIPKSISFADMDEDEFKEVYNKTLDFILKHFVTGVDQYDFELEILNFMN